MTNWPSGTGSTLVGSPSSDYWWVVNDEVAARPSATRLVSVACLDVTASIAAAIRAANYSIGTASANSEMIFRNALIRCRSSLAVSVAVARRSSSSRASSTAAWTELPRLVR